MTIDHHEAYQAREIIAVPIAVDIGLARPDSAGEDDIGIEAGAGHANRHVERSGLGDGTERFIQIGIDQSQSAMANLSQLTEQKSLCQFGESGYAVRRILGGVRRNDILFHDRPDSASHMSRMPVNGGTLQRFIRLTLRSEALGAPLPYRRRYRL